MRKIFIDSCYLIAVNNPSDSLHTKAKVVAPKIKAKRTIITDYVFLEMVTVLSQKVSRNFANQIGLSILSSNKIELIVIDQPIFFETWQIFTKLKPKNLSFVDCNILAMMRHHKIKKLLSFNHTDFAPLQKQFGFKLIT